MSRIRKTIALLVTSVLIATTITWLSIAGGSPERKDMKVKAGETYDLTTDAAGKVKDVRLVEFMDVKGEGDVSVVKDNTLESDALKWQGIHSFKVPRVEGDKLVWDDIKVDGNANVQSSAVLSGEAAKKIDGMIPLRMNYRYWFDGEEVTDPSTIIGKNGHFKLELKMTNTSKKKTMVPYTDPVTGQTLNKEVETYLPLVISPYDWYFDSKVFFNLSADPTGLVVRFPEFYTIGWSIPLFPPATEDTHTIWVEADVKNLSLPPLILSVNFIFPGTNQTDPIPEFQAALGELYNGVVQLDAGLKEAVAGLGSEEQADTMINGTSQILDGLKEMAGGLRSELIPGVDELAAGVGSEETPDTLLYAVDQTANGLNQMKAGIGAATTADSLLYGLDQIRGGMEQMKAGIGSPETPDTLLYAQSEVSGGLDEMKTGIGTAAAEDTLLYAMDQMQGGMTELKAGIGSPTVEDSLLYGMDQMRAGMAMIRDKYIGTPGTPDSFLFAMNEINGGLKDMFSGVGQLTDGVNLLQILATALDVELVSALVKNEEIKKLVSDNMPEPYRSQTISKINHLNAKLGVTLLGLVVGIQANIGPASKPGTVLNGLDQMKNGLGSPSTPDSLLYGVSEVQNGLELLKAEGINPLLGGVAQIEAGLEEAKAGLGSPVAGGTLLYAAEQVKQGLKAMKNGIGDANAEDTLQYGLSAMGQGLEDMKKGIGDAQATNTLLYAVTQVQNGLEVMKAGIGEATASDTLLYALSQVQGGLHQVREGLSTGDPDNPGIKEGLAMISSGLGSARTPDTLIYGMSQINSGAKELQQGISQATNEGTQVMAQGLVDGLAELSLTQGELQVIEERGKEFNHLIGATRDAENHLAFVYETPSVSSYKEGSSWKVALAIAIIIGIAMVGVGFAWRRRTVRAGS